MKRRRLFTILLLVFTLIFTSVVPGVYAEDNSSSSAAVPDRTDSELGINSKVAKSLDAKGYRSILVAGIDNGGRSDLILVLCYNEKSKKSTLFSVARDTYMQLNDKKIYYFDGRKREFSKCNRAAESGDMYVLMRELNRHMDLNIREYVALDWQCVADMIDALRDKGVYFEGNISSKSMLKAINFLIKGKGKTSKVTKTGKKVKLKGWQAVEYLRVRKFDGGTAELRESRNRDAFIQIFNKVKKMSVENAAYVFDAVSGEIQTNMQMGTIVSLIAGLSGSKMTVKNTPGWPYKYKLLWDPDGTLNYKVAISLSSNVKKLHSKAYPGVKYSQSSTVKKLNKRINKLKKSHLKTKKATLSSAKIASSTASFRAKGAKADPVVKLGGTILTKGTHYKVVKYKNNKSVGKGTFVVKGINGFTGSKKGSFTVLPANASGLALESSASAVKVTWKSQKAKMSKKRINGYQVQYGTSSSFKSATKKTIKGYKKHSYNIGNLSGDTTYYVRIRTYMKVGKKTYYSKWSKAVSAITVTESAEASE